MFSKSKSNSMNRSNEKLSDSVNAIGQGSIIAGDINTEGDLRIDGTVNGRINTKGLLVLGETGFIEGEVSCLNGVISGTVKAKIEVSELLSLKAKANLYGDIVTNKLSIEPGANFTGSCSMGAAVKKINQIDKDAGAKEKTA